MEHPIEYMERFLKLIMKRFDNLDTKLDKLTKPTTNMNTEASSHSNIDEEPFDNEDVLRLLKISFRTLQRYKQEKLLPYTKIKGKSYYKRSDVLNIINKKLK